MDIESVKNNFFKKYDNEGTKFLLTSMVGLLIICAFIPFIVTLFIKDTYPQINWMDKLQVFILVISALFCVGIMTAIILKKTKKVVSLLIFEISQSLILIIFIFSVHFLFIFALKDVWLQIVSIFIFIFGVAKIFKDITLKKDRQKNASKIMSTTDKYGSILFLIVIIIRWLIDLLIGKDKRISIFGALFPLLIVILEVFLIEYSFGRISTLIVLLKNQEYYRKKMDLSTKEWYGINSKEYKEESKYDRV